MTNHFTDLGFDVLEASDLTDLLAQGAGSADDIPLDSGGSLLRWAVGAGIELWIQVLPTGELVGVHPFFLGPSRIKFRIARVDVSRHEVEDGALMGWVSPGADPDVNPGAYPMRFDLPAYPLGVEGADDGDVRELQVAAFADEIAVYRDEKEFMEAQDLDAEFSVRSFVPIGLIPPEEEEEEEDPFGEGLLQYNPDFQPVAEALFSGEITRCEKRINPFTRNPFWWLQVSTYASEYDVVADAALLDREPQPGDIIQGHFWMAARLTD
jgi:hypothetical protein